MADDFKLERPQFREYTAEERRRIAFEQTGLLPHGESVVGAVQKRPALWFCTSCGASAEFPAKLCRPCQESLAAQEQHSSALSAARDAVVAACLAERKAYHALASNQEQGELERRRHAACDALIELERSNG